MFKKNNSTEEPELFSNKYEYQLKEGDRVLRDELNLALLPLSYFPSKKNKSKVSRNEAEFEVAPGRTVKLVSSEAGGGIPEGNDLDYFYGMQDLLFEQTGFKSDTIYFFITELIKITGKKVSQVEVHRALRAIKRYRYLIIESNAMKCIGDDGKVKYSEEAISYIQHSSIVGDVLKGGRRKITDTSMMGKIEVVFSKYFMQNIISKELSKPLNYTLMMKLRSSKSKKLFRMVDAFRHLESTFSQDGVEIIEKNIFEIAARLPLSEDDCKYPSRIKKNLDEMHKELKAIKYIEDHYYNNINNGINVVYVFSKFKTSQASAYNELIAYGVNQQTAETLALTKPPELIMDTIKYCNYKKEEKDEVTPGYLIKTIQNIDPIWLKRYLDQKEYEEKNKRLREEHNVRKKMRMFYELYVENLIREEIAGFSQAAMNELREKAIQNLKVNNQLQFVSKNKEGELLEAEMESIVKEKLDIESFENWLEENQEEYIHLI